jgi:hypothetical protein
VLFLNFRRGTFYRTSGWLGAFLIQGDTVRTMYPGAEIDGMKVEDFLAKLRALKGR